MIIIFANQKGGTGKTTSVMNTAAALSEMGKKVLMIDLDHQASLTKHTGDKSPDKNLDRNIYKVLQSYVTAENYGGPKSQDSFWSNIRQNTTIREYSYHLLV